MGISRAKADTQTDPGGRHGAHHFPGEARDVEDADSGGKPAGDPSHWAALEVQRHFESLGADDFAALNCSQLMELAGRQITAVFSNMLTTAQIEAIFSRSPADKEALLNLLDADQVKQVFDKLPEIAIPLLQSAKLVKLTPGQVGEKFNLLLAFQFEDMLLDQMTEIDPLQFGSYLLQVSRKCSTAQEREQQFLKIFGNKSVLDARQFVHHIANGVFVAEFLGDSELTAPFPAWARDLLSSIKKRNESRPQSRVRTWSAEQVSASYRFLEGADYAAMSPDQLRALSGDQITHVLRDLLTAGQVRDIFMRSLDLQLDDDTQLLLDRLDATQIGAVFDHVPGAALKGVRTGNLSFVSSAQVRDNLNFLQPAQFGALRLSQTLEVTPLAFFNYLLKMYEDFGKDQNYNLFVDAFGEFPSEQRIAFVERMFSSDLDWVRFKDQLPVWAKEYVAMPRERWHL